MLFTFDLSFVIFNRFFRQWAINLTYTNKKESFFSDCLYIYIDIAWSTITEFATEILKSSKEEDSEEKEKEDVLKAMEKKTSEALKHKRSFFVRMVSDPKLYNPKIVKVSHCKDLEDYFGGPCLVN